MNTKNIAWILVVGAILFIGSASAEIPEQQMGLVSLPVIAPPDETILNDLFVFGRTHNVTGSVMSTSYIFVEEVPESVVIVWLDENEKGIGCSFLDGPVPGIESKKMRLILSFPEATQFKVFRL